MFRRLPIMLALAVAPACSYVQKLNPWHHAAAPATEDDQRLSELGATPDAPAEASEQSRDKLRASRDRAWAGLAHGGKVKGYSCDDARALSALEQQLDAAHPTAHGKLVDLPRGAWWYLFVPPSAWSRGPLSIDRERMPGYYAGMMAALDHLAARADKGAPPLTVDAYLELATLSTRGVFEKETPVHPGFAESPTRYPIAPIHDLSTLHVEHLAQSLAELKAEGVAGWNGEMQRERSGDPPPAWLAKILGAHEDVNPHNKPARLVYQRSHGKHGGAGFTEWLVAWNHYDAHEARKWAAQWFADYDAEQAAIAAGAGDQTASLRAIARLVRRLEVSHVLAARSDALDATLVLQYLLAARGLAPSIVEDPTIFGGREPLDELVAEIAKGQTRYQALVKELGARTAAPAAMPTAPTAGPEDMQPASEPLPELD